MELIQHSLLYYLERTYSYTGFTVSATLVSFSASFLSSLKFGGRQLHTLRTSNTYLNVRTVLLFLNEMYDMYVLNDKFERSFLCYISLGGLRDVAGD